MESVFQDKDNRKALINCRVSCKDYHILVHWHEDLPVYKKTHKAMFNKSTISHENLGFVEMKAFTYLFQ